MGEESFSKMLWPDIKSVYLVCFWCLASNGKSVKCWCGNIKVDVATATPAIPTLRSTLLVISYSNIMVREF